MIFVVFDFCFRLIVWEILLRGTCGVMSVDVKLKGEGNVKFLRQTPLTFTKEHKEKIIKMHNYYRSKAKSPASAMRLMNWDDEIERYAQTWASKCEFKEMPDRHENIRMGENLYAGSDKTGAEATFLWWNETHNYDALNDTCKPGAQCVNYTQMLRAESDRIGCGISACPKWNFIVCRYQPVPKNYKSKRPYKVGKPCSQCNTTSGGLCFKNLCVEDEECETLGLQCSCPLQCRNCGVLDIKNCRCQCKDGWDSLDCSKQCKDAHPHCGKKPGFSTNESCVRPRIKIVLCRLMCGQCVPTPPGYSKLVCDPEVSERKLEVRCKGKTCPEGYILDKDNCECLKTKLGPGSIHDNTGSQIKFSLFIFLLLIISLGV